MANIENISVNGFKSLFKRDFPYLPYWNPNIVYFKGDIVFYNNNFYISTIDYNTSVPDGTNTYYTKAETDAIVAGVEQEITNTNNTITAVRTELLNTIEAEHTAVYETIGAVQTEITTIKADITELASVKADTTVTTSIIADVTELASIKADKTETATIIADLTELTQEVSGIVILPDYEDLPE